MSVTLSLFMASFIAQNAFVTLRIIVEAIIGTGNTEYIVRAVPLLKYDVPKGALKAGSNQPLVKGPSAMTERNL